MNFFKNLLGWGATSPPIVAPPVLPGPVPKLPKGDPSEDEQIQKKKKTKQKKKKPDIKAEKALSPALEVAQPMIEIEEQDRFSDSGEGFTRVEKKRKKRKSKQFNGRQGYNSKRSSGKRWDEKGSRNGKDRSWRKRNGKKKNGKKNGKPRTESGPSRHKGVLLRAVAPSEPAWAERSYVPPVPTEHSWRSDMEQVDSFERQMIQSDCDAWERQRMQKPQSLKPRGGPATPVPPPNDVEVPFESYASLKEGPTIETPATQNIFIGFDPENKQDHELLDAHLRAQVTHGDFIEVWSSVLNNWTVAQIYESRDGKISARYVSSPAFKVVERYDSTSWRPCRADPITHTKYDRSDVGLQRLVKVYSEGHKKWMLGHVVGAVESIEEGPLVHIRLLQYLNQVVDISLYSPYLIPLPKGTSEELWRYIDAEEDRSPTPPEREVIHFRRTRRLKEILFCKELSTLNKIVEPVFRDQQISTCILSFVMDDEIEFDASVDLASALVDCAEQMQAVNFPGLTFSLRHLRIRFLQELTDALKDKTVFQSLKLLGSKNHRMEAFPLRLKGLSSLEMHDVKISDDEFEEFIWTANKASEMRLMSIFGVIDSTGKRDILQALRDEFPLIEISTNLDEAKSSSTDILNDI